MTEQNNYISQRKFAELLNINVAITTRWKDRGLLVFVDNKVDVKKSIEKLKRHGSLPKKSQQYKDNLEKIKEDIEDFDDDDQEEKEDLNDINNAQDYLNNGVLLDKADAEKLRENYQAFIKKLEFERKAGSLVDVQEVKKNMANFWTLEKQALLDELPIIIATHFVSKFNLDLSEVMIESKNKIREFIEKRNKTPKL